jgi:hypothetical protein
MLGTEEAMMADALGSLSASRMRVDPLMPLAPRRHSRNKSARKPLRPHGRLRIESLAFANRG